MKLSDNVQQECNNLAEDVVRAVQDFHKRTGLTASIEVRWTKVRFLGVRETQNLLDGVTVSCGDVEARVGPSGDDDILSRTSAAEGEKVSTSGGRVGF